MKISFEMIKYESLISIIIPFYNVEEFIYQSILSALNQDHQILELLLINDGSTDNSKNIAFSFQDSRIRYFEQENKGVSAARNVGLENMNGEYFCFLDADDVLPKNSLSARLNVFKKNPSLEFVDGTVNIYDTFMVNIHSIWTPDFKENPLEDLVSLSGRSFFGSSWMIKRNPNETYKMKVGQSHGEDLLFYLSLARQGGKYDFTNKVVLDYRNTPGSAMKDLEGLEQGYINIEREITNWPEVSRQMLRTFTWKYRKSMSLSYIKKGNFLRACKVWVQ